MGSTAHISQTEVIKFIFNMLEQKGCVLIRVDNKQKEKLFKLSSTLLQVWLIATVIGMPENGLPDDRVQTRSRIRLN
jgi:hypothetical protein